MNSKFKFALAVIASAALGAAAMQGLHAQAKPKAYTVTETEVIPISANSAAPIRHASISPRTAITTGRTRRARRTPRARCRCGAARRREMGDRVRRADAARAARASPGSWPCPTRDASRSRRTRTNSCAGCSRLCRPVAGAHPHHRRRVPFLHAPDRAAGGRRARRGRARRRPSPSRAFRSASRPPRGGGHDLVFVSQVFFNSAATRRRSRASSRAVPNRDDADRDRRLSRLHGAADRSRGASPAARSISPAATNMRWRAKAPASCIARRALRRGRATPAGSRPSARSAAKADGRGLRRRRLRFMGATFDPSGLYRLAAVFDWMDEIGLTVDGDPRPRAGAAGRVPDRGRARQVRRSARRGWSRRSRRCGARTFPHLRDSPARRRCTATCARQHRHRRARRPHPLRLRLLPHRGRDRGRGRRHRAGAGLIL